MQRKKAVVDAAIDKAQEERGVVIVITGNGKGKTTSGFGTLYRALGHGQQVGVVQFIKGTQTSGEVTFLQQCELPRLTLFCHVDGVYLEYSRLGSRPTGCH